MRREHFKPLLGQSGKWGREAFYKMCDYLARRMKRGEGDGEISKMDMLMNTAIEEDGDFLVNEKDKYVMLTANGVKEVEQFFHIENLSDPENIEIQHNIILALRAHNLMFRDRDYVVKDDEVLIVDDFNGLYRCCPANAQPRINDCPVLCPHRYDLRSYPHTRRT